VSNSYTIIPSAKGKYPVPKVTFSFFNPATGNYKTLSSDEIMINVMGGTGGADLSGSGPFAGNKQLVTTAGSQFHFIKLQPGLSPTTSAHFFGSPCFYLWLLLPLLMIPIAIIFGKRRDAIASDVVGNKVKRANKLARKYLSKAKRELGNKEAFYIALEKALHNYLKAKLKIETTEFSKDKIAALLQQKEVDDTTSGGFINLLKNCEMARYSPFSDVQMQQDYDKASEVIAIMDKQL
jgi:hypothetical protein